ncbi:MAG: hypothetical protein A2171_00280 [Candidatus Levybacteria bacterium RBG_13_35_9]|nr:MAG: hypothetical protein A2171_00280 [Candidatus Levybacteria bacterium RBG_13_35_9]
MAKFASRGGRQNLLQSVWEAFLEQDTFTKMFLVIAVLTIVAVPAVVSNRQSFLQYAGKPSDFVSTIVLNQTDTVPALGVYVTFSTSYPKNIRNPRIEVLCYQDNNLVYGEAGSVGDAFLLGGAGSKWIYETPEIGTECKANLFYFGSYKGDQTYNQLATTSFTALGRQ